MIDAWAAWLTGAAWQAALVVAAVWAVDRLCGERLWPQVRHALWLVVAAKLVAPPSLTASWGMLPAEAPAAAPAHPGWALGWLAVTVTLGALTLLRARRRRRALAAGRVDVPPVARAALAAAVRACGLRRAPRLWVSRAAVTPCVFGCVRPTVVLPDGSAGALSADELRHVLLHEVAHVARRDLWWQAAFDALRALYWFHPGVWIARARAAALREICCDLAVARALGDDAAAYRATLARFARAGLNEPAPGVAGFLLGPATILARLRALDRGHAPTRRRRAVAAGLAVTLGLFALPTPPVATPSPLDDLAAARHDFAAALDARGTAGSVQMRYAALRLHALQEKQENR